MSSLIGVVKRFVALVLAVSAFTCAANTGDDDETTQTTATAAAALCVTKWNATWQQGSGANNWWIEYAIGGDTVASAYLEVVGRGDVPLRVEWNKWVGSTAKIETGASVVVHAVNSRGEHTQSASFRYLVDTAPPTATCPDADAGGSGSDTGSGDSGGGGTCTFNPTWAQAAGANNWWIEYAINGGGSGSTISSATLEVVGRGTVSLRLEWNKWVGSTAKIDTGASVILRAVNSAGQTARTDSFRYLIDTAPRTAGCGSSSSESGLDTRPSNPSCIAPARPVTTNAMRFERVFPNVAVNQAMQIAQPPGDSSRWFVMDRQGRLFSFSATNPSATATQIANVATIAGKPVRTELSGGLLGFAFHPNFTANGRLYVSFTTSSSTGGYLSEVGYINSVNGGQTFTSYTKVFSFPRAELEWNGGAIAFGPDGHLYLGFGASSTDGAQSRTTYYGKILRIDVNNPSGGRAYGIPSSNPFAAGGGHPEIYAWGFRQPWRFSFDRMTGDFWVGDVGQSGWEEVDRVTVGRNYGWPCREGAHDYASSDPSKCPTGTSGLVDPVYEYPANGPAAVVGGYMYRGSVAPDFNGTYVYGDQVRNQAYAFRYNASTNQATPVAINEGGASIGFTSFAEDNAGEIYTTAVFQTGIYKLVPSGGGSSTFPDRLTRTGCFSTTDAKTAAAGLIPYTVNAALWSDGFDKERMLALPNGTRISVGADGDFNLPVGSVLVKTFSTAGKRIETRLFVRHTDGDWAGYTYEWNDAQTDAFLLPGEKTKAVGTGTWTFPSRSDCMRCHTVAAGRTLGLELGQLNGDFTYASTGRTANQLKTLAHIGLFAAALPASPPAYPRYNNSAAPIDARARAYLHANCSNCHRPSGNAGRSTMDLRFATSFAGTNTCGVTPLAGDLGVANARLIAPLSPDTSIVSLRARRLDGSRMPPLASRVVDAEGTNLIDNWIRSVSSCP